MYFWKDRQGNKLTYKEFIKRFKSGVEGVTELQKINMQIRSTWIMLFGIVCGIVVSAFFFRTAWWLIIILVGGLFNTAIQQLSLYQKRDWLKMIEKNIVEVDNGFA